MKSLRSALFIGCLLYAAVAQAGEGSDPRQLSAEENRAITELAEKTLKDKGLWKGKILRTNTEVVLDDSAKTPERVALLTYYRYQGDLGIVVCINIGTKKIISVRSDPHLATSLTAEELAEAEKLARSDVGVKKALAYYKHLDKIE